MSRGAFDRLIALLPHRPPALLLEHVHEATPGCSACGSVRFPAGHRAFAGHLPGDPLVPGVMLVEALAQLAGVALMPEGARAPIRGYLAQIDAMRFHRPVRPGEEVELIVELQAAFGSFARFSVSALVAGERAAEGRITVVRGPEREEPAAGEGGR